MLGIVRSTRTSNHTNNGERGKRDVPGVLTTIRRHETAAVAAVQKNINDETIKQLEKECVRAMGLVTRMIDPQSREARENAKALRAIEEELEQLIAGGCFNYNEVEEWSDVALRDKNLRWVSCMMLLGKKNIERDIQYQKWKGRLVAPGNKVYGIDGNKIVDQLNHATPASSSQSTP